MRDVSLSEDHTKSNSAITLRGSDPGHLASLSAAPQSLKGNAHTDSPASLLSHKFKHADVMWRGADTEPCPVVLGFAPSELTQPAGGVTPGREHPPPYSDADPHYT
ncbi:unnamed protein product [Pleuronectes platessa]|uniref:Uncharacterized protein n=1 Tax=Pleuronectes platessa TaxID=8262 RepID=A0A9N7VVG4_PLEPL|nr:unnamed protein product [Pleuronectes platessa]